MLCKSKTAGIVELKIPAPARLQKPVNAEELQMKKLGLPDRANVDPPTPVFWL